jgi:hypothetical protein
LVQFLKETINPKVLKALFTRNGSAVIPGDFCWLERLLGSGGL